MTYKALNNLAPQYLTNLLHPLSEISHFNTRSASDGNLYPPIFKTSMGQRSFTFSATKVWNMIPPSIRRSETLPSFKSRLRNYLFEKFVNEGSELD